MSIRTARKINPDDIKLQAVIDIAGVMFVVIDADQNVALINKKGCEILGYEKEEIIGRNWFDIFIPERIREGIRAVWEMLMAGEIEPLEYFENPVLAKDGTERIILWRNALLSDESGTIFGTLSSGEDITEQRNLDYQMRKLSMAMEQSPTAVVITDSSGIVEYANPSFSRLTGYEAEEVSGGECPILFSKEMPNDICRDIWKNIMNGDTWRGEFLNKKKNGEPFWAGISISPIKGYDGRITHHVTFMKDITDQKLAEEKRQRQTEKMAVVGRLAAGVAHEINNPLSGIILCMNKLTKSNVDDSTKESLMHAVDGGLRKIKKIVEQLLDFSRTTITEKAPKNINMIIERLMPLLDYQASKNNITVFKNLGNVPEIPADENKLGQVFVNLILNAIQAMPDGGTLTIETTLEQGFCVISIKDTGPGIPESIMPYIFDPFFTTKEVGKGTGLGLSISKSIIEQHGGTIAAENVIGAGTIFKVKLPIVVG